MLLRRVIEHVREQNWTAVGIDFVIVVVGVFFGIQVANWNEARRDHAREAEFISRLQRDFEAIDARLDDNIAYWRDYSAAPRKILADLALFRQQGSWPRPKEQSLSDITDVFNARVPAPRAATYVELLSAGQLGLLRNVTLRDALLEYDMQVGYSQTSFDILIQRSLPHMASLIAHLEFDPTFDDAELPAASQVHEVWTDVDLLGMATDPASDVALKVYASASANQLRGAKLQQEKAIAVLAQLKPGRVASSGKHP